ncbi:NADH-quinone oxidoreductase subunit NuoH [Pontibacter cellulosilyticus]|uniref:NADH-quinone oxidoreductase subunit H n=1 Tax=Pontibacter cellulosilyticus TaxID=1720253 RepID=A0A923N7P8_9BACT|nr:NADH-quinone oxidoreductase subunit NuoH [Pontibacter cellulosilyticus]MBC5993741.1 NADH-quinone oxidoreductase subunit NuoH [Pontibacter cellulosilyticus]
MESVDLLYKAIYIIAIFGITLLIATYSTYFERKIAAFIQDRVGPNRAGPLGLLQPLADAGKLFFKEDFIPSKSSKALFILGPGIAMLVATMSSAVVPFGDNLIIGGHEINLIAIDVNIGVLYVFGVVSLGVYGLMVGGWASNNKFSLLGAIRAASQNISYELAMGLSLIAILMLSGTLSLREIAEQQQGFNWNIWYQPLGFLIFLVCAFAETNRTPFDLPESEAELIGGYHTEYGSMKLGMYLFAEYINIFVASAVMATLYFGAYNFPFMLELEAWLVNATEDAVTANNIVTLIGVAVMFAKIFLFIFFFMWVRWTLPRFRYDQLMKLGWQILIPLAILNILLTGGGILLKDYLF